ncbi:TonB-dependent receptor [Fulvivirga ulvae]|uniref:SusC/RagA family TonB-linked outer membrane protein n=1 Tax=Fulvivirga ulvae TaxID=2904245 RepID=UPI001F285AD4|nr:TonB-dependent receptor [Fulvivirga ulvae]UII31681.1 TonB-dependent receptor [Fulvivirga ulvae]
MKNSLLTALLLLLTTLTYAQGVVSGTVKDETGEPLPGVNVLVRGTSQGTVTDISGNYRLEVPENASLIFSFIGYVTEEINVGNRTTIDLVLIPDITALNEVVVIGYGTTTKKELTGAVSVVQAEEIQALNPTRIEQALQGQMAGVNVTTASGSPGGGANIRIRGITTNGNNNPLVLVDDVPYSVDGLSALNPNDIESVNVLKDASASIYGVQAANGVILITTKKGKQNTAPRFTFDSYYGIQETSRKLALLNATEYAVLANEAFANGGQTPPFANVNLGEGTDWQDEVFDRAPIQNYNLSVNGGGEKTTYSIGGSYFDQEGIVGGDKASFQRYNTRMNLTTELTDKLTFQNVLLYANETRRTLPENGQASVLYNTINMAPTMSVYDQDGNFTLADGLGSEVINPLAQIANTFNRNRVDKLTGKLSLTYDILDDLKVTTRFGYNYANVRNKTFNPYVYYGQNKVQNNTLNANLDPITKLDTLTNSQVQTVFNSVSETQQIFYDNIWETFVNYKKVLNEKHGFDVTLGMSVRKERGESLTGTAFDIPYNSYEFADISAADPNNDENTATSYQYDFRQLSYFTRVQYDYENRYLLSLIVRRDASTRFGPNNRVGYFPSASAAWIVSDESFFDVSFINLLKLRASYGVSGNDKIQDFVYRGLLNGEGVYVLNGELVTGRAPGRISNPDVKWEQLKQANFGFDLRLFEGKVSASVDYFVKRTEDLLLQPQVSGLLGSGAPGSAAPFINAGTIENRGFEFIVGYSGEISNDVQFSVNYNLSTLTNETVELANGVDFIPGGSFGIGQTATRFEVGYPIGYFFGLETEGVFQSQEDINQHPAQQNASPGDLKYKDGDGDGVVELDNNDDKTLIGSPIPDVTMGVSLNVRYRNIDFSTNIYSALGNDILRNYSRFLPLTNKSAHTLERWTGAGSTNTDPKVTTGANNNNLISDYYVEDGSYARIRNIQLGYTLPAELTERVGINKFRIYASVNNLYTYTKYRGYDPDVSSGEALSSGIDYGFYPQPRTYMLGLNLIF